jgi:hypothetical protein
MCDFRRAHTAQGDYEGLGDDYEATPYVPPSELRARERRHRSIFLAGEGACAR